ncbi:MAG: diaminopimelate decarboxylase [Geminicoccaceae bacterium]
MSLFAYRDGTLHVDQVALAAIAETAGTPVYVYAAEAIRERFRRLDEAFPGQPVLFCYALKANSTLAIIRLLADLGAGADIVSGGELSRALAAGVPPARIAFSGVAKTRDEIEAALAAGIHQFNVESIDELVAISEVAVQRQQAAPVALRVNPDVAAGTHEKISTGRKSDKFGITLDRLDDAITVARRLGGIELVGLHVHIGSQIAATADFERAYQRVVDTARSLRAEGIQITRLNLGGGFGVAYDGEAPFDLPGFAQMVRRLTQGLDVELLFEPGRYLVAEAGLLLTRAIYVKAAAERRFLVLDAGMNNFIRPAMYGARHRLLPVDQPPAGAPVECYDVVGPICESSDLFSRDVALPVTAAGALLAFAGVGAYGSVMASDYNSRPRAAEVLVDGAKSAVIKPRVEPAEQMVGETWPDWLAPALVSSGTGRS